MIGNRRTDFEYFDLQRLTVDGDPIQFTSATLTTETLLTRAGDDWIRDPTHWYGQIVSESCRPDFRIAHEIVAHTRESETQPSQTLSGFFMVGWTNSRGVDITGSGSLVVG